MQRLSLSKAKASVITTLLVAVLSLFSCSGPSASGLGYSDFWKPEETTVYKNELLDGMYLPAITRIEVNLQDQLATLYLADEKLMVARCSTGVRENTPKGTFKVLEKFNTGKRSNIFGIIKDDLGNTVHSGDRRYYKGNATNYEGYEMLNWMRLTGSGIGIHFSEAIFKFPASGGCVRLGKEAAETFYKHAQVGTPVVIY